MIQLQLKRVKAAKGLSNSSSKNATPRKSGKSSRFHSSQTQIKVAEPANQLPKIHKNPAAAATQPDKQRFNLGSDPYSLASQGPSAAAPTQPNTVAKIDAGAAVDSAQRKAHKSRLPLHQKRHSNQPALIAASLAPIKRSLAASAR